MKHYILALLLPLSILLTTTSHAETVTPRVSLPTVETSVVRDYTVNLPDGEYKCMDVNQWKLVILMAVDYHALYDWRLETQGTLKLYSETVALYESSLDNLRRQLRLTDTHNEYLSLRLSETEKHQSREAFRSKAERIALYAVISVQMVVIGVVGVRGASK
jgi:hypothetical protein